MFSALCVASSYNVCVLLSIQAVNEQSRRAAKKGRRIRERERAFYMPTLLARFVWSVFSRRRRREEKRRGEKEKKKDNK